MVVNDESMAGWQRVVSVQVLRGGAVLTETRFKGAGNETRF